MMGGVGVFLSYSYSTELVVLAPTGGVGAVRSNKTGFLHAR